MTGGVKLLLLIGPIVPIPAPPFFVEAVESVEVTNASSGPSGFQIRLKIDRRSALNDLLLVVAGGSASPAMPSLRVVIAVLMGGAAQPLFDGVMTRAEVTAGANGGPGSITVTGDDLTAVMDRVDFSGLPYPAMPVVARVAMVVAKYAMFGIAPLPVPPIAPDVPLPTDRIPAHRGTDLAYLRDLAARCGHVFYIEPGPVVGTNIAYWGPELKIGAPQPALNLDMDALTNVRSLSFTFEPLKGVLPVVFIRPRELPAPIPIPIPKLNPLQPPLAALPTSIANVKLMTETARMSPADALNAGIAEAARSQDSASATGSLDVLRYGRPLRARALVGVRGAGLPHDGLWYVSETTTTLKRGEFTQSFKLTRNGLLPTVPRVAA